MGQGPQKADHGGNFFMTPRRVVDSVAWRHLSHRARSILQVFQHACDGFNNGEIEFGIHAIGKATGNQNHGANSKAVAELIEKGFLECTSDADAKVAKVRAYRITFIGTGKAKNLAPATHEYRDWRPTGVKKRKFGGARTATQNPSSVAVTATEMKNSVAETTTPATESCGFEADPRVAVTALSLDNHSVGGSFSPPRSAKSPGNMGGPITADLDVLRHWASRVIQMHGYGGARTLATEADIPEPTLSRFRSGKNLPDRYRLSLQHACAKHIPFRELAA